MGSVFILLCIFGCVRSSGVRSRAEESFGVMVMAHGGSEEWNRGVVETVDALRDRYTVEIAFGMADAVTIQGATARLEGRGVREVAVVRLFVSGTSWYDRTEQILGIQGGAPARPTPESHASHTHGQGEAPAHGGHHMEFWRIESDASFAVSEQGLSEAAEMGSILAERATALSRRPELEDVLILAHGPGDDAENERWIANIDALADSIRMTASFRRVEVQTLREDWSDKRKPAERRIRAFVERAGKEEGRAIVIPFRVYGFGPYAKVLDGLEYISDGRGLIPHEVVTRWIAKQAESLRGGPFYARR